MTTPRQPDNDTVDDPTHAGEGDPAAGGRTPSPQDPAEGPDTADGSGDGD